MFDDTGLSFLVSQLGYQIPKLFVYLVGFAMALSFKSRAPRASTLTLIGTALLMVNTVGSDMVMAFLVSRSDFNHVGLWSAERCMLFARSESNDARGQVSDNLKLAGTGLLCESTSPPANFKLSDT